MIEKYSKTILSIQYLQLSYTTSLFAILLWLQAETFSVETRFLNGKTQGLILKMYVMPISTNLC